MRMRYYIDRILIGPDKCRTKVRDGEVCGEGGGGGRLLNGWLSWGHKLHCHLDGKYILKNSVQLKGKNNDPISLNSFFTLFFVRLLT